MKGTVTNMVKQTKQAKNGEGRGVTMYRGEPCETVEVLGMSMPVPLANKLKRHLQTQTKAGRLLAALSAQEDAARRPS